VCVCPLGFSIQSGGEGSSCGQVTRPLKPGRNGFLFLPQRSYVTEGTFLEQVVYPDEKSGNPEKGLFDRLEEVGAETEVLGAGRKAHLETEVLNACRKAGLEKVMPQNASTDRFDTFLLLWETR
jgi:ABC-type uncharacterized transport system fused permease/ATPase subunit